MKFQIPKFKVQSLGIVLLVLTALSMLPSAAAAGKKWQGVDESVIEKVAKEHGREVRQPWINTDQGDLLLFVFLLAGAAGGFIAGYYWRALTGKKGEKVEIQKGKA